jgi:hypothetical protein
LGGGTSITPSSGTALTLSPPAGQLAVLVNDTAAGGLRCVNSGNTSGFDVGLLGGTSVADAYVYNRNVASGALILGTKNSSRINIGLAGNVTIAAPDSGVALTASAASGGITAVLNANASFALQIASPAANFAGIQFAQSGQTTCAVYNAASTGDLRLQTNSVDRMSITNAGNVTIAAPSSGRTLTTTGTAAGTAALRLNTTATNAGTQTATWTAPINKPGAAAGVVSQWIPIDLDGTTYYIPAWT